VLLLLLPHSWAWKELRMPQHWLDLKMLGKLKGQPQLLHQQQQQQQRGGRQQQCLQQQKLGPQMMAAVQSAVRRISREIR